MAQTKATAKYVRVSAWKVRQLTNLIKGEHVEEARRILRFSAKGASQPLAKVLNSAIANAENNEGLDPDELWVLNAYVDEGPTMKRFRPRALGRAYRVRKRSSHITVSVGTREA
jgi:large subunit ribosomal protein L22